MANNGPHPVDVHVGARVRARRKLKGVSQLELGNAVGLTFQQIQKYEGGQNRISASKLYEIGERLSVPVSVFFEGLSELRPPAAIGADLETFLADRDGRDLAASFMSMSPALRAEVTALVEALGRPA